MESASHPLSPEQQKALKLHRLGFNVFPLPLEKKGGFRWKKLVYTHLEFFHVLPLFAFPCNAAVMMGRTSDNLFVLDCETEAVLAEQTQKLRSAGIPIWMSKTGGAARGGHLFLRCADGEVINIHPGVYPDLEVRGNGCYVVVPPSIHPDTGLFYEWGLRETTAPPLVSLKQLDWLKLRVTKQNSHTPLPYPDLSARNRDFLLHGAHEGERNNRLFSAACDIVGNNYHHQQTINQLAAAAQNSGLEMSEIRKTIASALSKPRLPAKPDLQQEDDKQPAWYKARYWAEHREWTGRTAEVDRAAFLAACERGKKADGQGRFRTAVREIANFARITHSTASKALRRLVEAGYLIKEITHDKASESSLYRFGAETQLNLQDWYTEYFPAGMDVNVLNLQMLPDASEQGALGKAAYRIYRVMCTVDEQLTAKEWAAAAQVSLGKLYRALTKLIEWGLVVKHAEHRYSPVLKSDSQLEKEVAVPAGTLGKGERRRQRHEQQRKGHAFNLLIRDVARVNGVVWRGPKGLWGHEAIVAGGSVDRDSSVHRVAPPLFYERREQIQLE